jgi:hypothetical protein
MENKLCIKCQNFLEFEEGSCECDYDKFEKTTKIAAMVYVAELFDCDYYEKHL